MSDRICVIEMRTGPRQDEIALFSDGETGTWRLFVDRRGNSDFTLADLKAFVARLQGVLADIERDPDGFNAERRATWVVTS